MQNNIKLISGNANIPLAQEISKILDVPLSDRTLTRFSDGESYVRINENMRGQDVFVIQSTSEPANETLMELLILIDALKRASAERITVVLPYYGYSRQDRKATSREPISAKLVADLITSAGANRVLTVHLHAAQIQGFFNIPLDNLLSLPLFVDYFKERDLSDYVVVAPDEGSVKLSNELAKKLHLPLVIIIKQRSYDVDGHDKIEKCTLLGDIKDKNVILFDDIISTAGTLCNAKEILKENGAKKICLGCTHAVFAGSAIERLKDPDINEVVVSNTIKIPEHKKLEKIKIISISDLLAKAIKRIHTSESVSSLFV